MRGEKKCFLSFSALTVLCSAVERSLVEVSARTKHAQPLTLELFLKVFGGVFIANLVLYSHLSSSLYVLFAVTYPFIL